MDTPTEFDTIYKEYYPAMFGLAFKMLGNEDDVPDIVQEAFIGLYNSMTKKNIKNYKNWLYRTTYNKCIDLYRKRKHTIEIESVEDFEIEGDQINGQEISKTIQLALSKLKPNEKAVAILYSEGLSYKEIAETTGIKLSSVGKTLSRTLAKLGKELKTKKHELY